MTRVNKTTPTTPARHTGFKAVSIGWGDNKTDQPTESPSPLMGEESKVRVITRQHQHPVIPAQAGIYRAGNSHGCAAYRHCGLDPRSRGEAAGTRHAEYLLDTTVAQARTGFKPVSIER